MAEWLYEAGIGEARAALVDQGRIIEAVIEPEGSGPRADTIARARFVETIIPRMNGRVTIDGVGDALLDGIPAGLSEGASLMVRIVREAIYEPGRDKLPRAVAAPEAELPQAGPDLLHRIMASAHPVKQCHAHEPDLLEAAGWSETLDEAEHGEIAFPGGVLRLAMTPAMTLFDVDGTLPGPALALAAASAAGAAILRHGIGGSIGIDFPTLPDKAARKAVGEALDAALPLPFERTAINGFGFMQIVRRRTRPSLGEIIRADRPSAQLRAALRRIEREAAIAARPPALAPELAARLAARPEWRAELERRTGRAIETAG